ncbi:Translation elongation factor EF-G2 [Gracilaria domingensis]|nr:Translation elongation factor EF-G2 [Gracilaria domingensis]
MDYLPQERQRGITISAASSCLPWRGHRFFIVDSPGHLDFTYEVETCLRAIDSVLVLLDAVAAVQPQTETVWRQADANNLPRVVFVNKMDRDAADLHRVVRNLKQSFHTSPAILHYPIFAHGVFTGSFNLLHTFPDQVTDELQPIPSVPDAYHAQVRRAADELLETVADVDDQIMSLYLDSQPITRQQMRTALRNACISNRLVPVLCGSSLKRIGVEQLMDAVVDYLPAPTERMSVHAQSVDSQQPVTYDRHRGRLVHLRAFAGSLPDGKKLLLNTTQGRTDMPTKLLRVIADKFVEIDSVQTGDIFAATGLQNTQTGDTIVLKHSPKSSHVVMETVRPPPAVFTVALSAETNSQEKELEEELFRFVEADASLETRVDEETGEILLSGMGELHLEVTVERMKRALQFPLHVSKPRVAYRESVTTSARGTEVYDTVIGSQQLYACLDVSIEPLEDDQYHNEIEVNGFSSKEEDEAVRQGLKAALGRGVLLGNPVTNIRARAFKGKDNAAEVDLVALRACAGKALRNLISECSPTLLEPVMLVELNVPEEHAGDVISELSHPIRRRGLIEFVERVVHGEKSKDARHLCMIRASVPVEGLVGWASKMRSLTKGRGDMSMEFSCYRAVDDSTKRRVVEQWCGV